MLLFIVSLALMPQIIFLFSDPFFSIITWQYNSNRTLCWSFSSTVRRRIKKEKLVFSIFIHRSNLSCKKQSTLDNKSPKPSVHMTSSLTTYLTNSPLEPRKEIGDVLTHFSTSSSTGIPHLLLGVKTHLMSSYSSGKEFLRERKFCVMVLVILQPTFAFPPSLTNTIKLPRKNQVVRQTSSGKKAQETSSKRDKKSSTLE